MTQTVSVGVHGGELTISPANVTLTLTPDPATGIASAELPPVTVSDGRGTLAGWTASIRATQPVRGLRVQPGEVRVVDGFASGVHAGAGAALIRAERGEGGGTFALDGGVVRVRATAPVRVELTLTVQ